MSYLPDLQEISYKLFSGPGYNHHLPGPRITGIPRLPFPLSSKQVNPTVLYGKLSTVISSVQVDNLPRQPVYISSSHWMHTSLSRLSFCKCSAPCVYFLCHCCQSDITFGLRDGNFISSSHRAPPCADTQQIILSWMNNRRACSQRLGQIGRVKFFRVSGTVCDEGVRALRMCRLGTEDSTVQAIYISPFPDGDMYWCFLSFLSAAVFIRWMLLFALG